MTEQVAMQTGVVAPVGTPDPNRPAWLDVKFQKPEDLAAAYVAAQQKITELTTAPTKTPEQLAADAKLDMPALTKEYMANGGKLTEATLADLAKRGIPQAALDTYTKGMQAQADALTAAITKAAGTPEKLTAIMQWADSALAETEKAAFNAVLDSGDAAQAKIAFDGLVARYTAAVGREPNLVTGAGAVTNLGVKGFASAAEMVAAMRDTRYRNGDTAYIAEVEARVAASSGLVSTRVL